MEWEDLVEAGERNSLGASSACFGNRWKRCFCRRFLRLAGHEVGRHELVLAGKWTARKRAGSGRCRWRSFRGRLFWRTKMEWGHLDAARSKRQRHRLCHRCSNQRGFRWRKFHAGWKLVRSKHRKVERHRLVRARFRSRSEEHTSELQSLRHLVCRLLLEKKN